MRLFGLKNCDTCRKAKKNLEAKGYFVTLVDVRNDNFEAALIEAALAQFGDKLLNTRSTTWRGLSEQDRKRPVLELLAEYPALMKRPLLERDGQMTLGWDSATQAYWLNNA